MGLLITISSFPPQKIRVTNKSFPEAMVLKTDILFPQKIAHFYKNVLEMHV
jgi:hypothetical protein